MYVCPPCDVEVAIAVSDRDHRIAADAVTRAMAYSGLPRDYRVKARTLNDVPAGSACRDLLPLLGQAEVPGLLLIGKSRSFKTTAAASLLAEAIGRGGTGRFVDATDLMVEIHEGYKGGENAESRAAIVERYAAAPHLVLDDLGQEKASSHAGEVIRQILDRRRRNWAPGQWVIITSNRTPVELCGRFAVPETGDAIMHRIAQLTVTVEMKS